MEVITSLGIEQHAIHRKHKKFGLEKTLKMYMTSIFVQ